MKSKFVAIATGVLFLAASWAVAGTKTGDGADQLSKVKKSGLPKSQIHLGVKTTQAPVIWSDDFEGTQANWITDASWNLIDTPGGGREFQDSTAWELVEDNSNSPTHSWHAQPTLNEELDFVISPVIYLPTTVEVEGVTSPLKGLQLGYYIDVDLPGGIYNIGHLVGPAETWWHFTSDNPGAGNSSWYMEPVDIPHWRQWIMTPPIDLTGATGAVTLSFMHRYDSEPEFDYYAVDVSTDGFQSYTNLASYDGSNPQPDWTDVNLDLSPWAGQVIQIRFTSKGDYGVAEGFWSIDEIKVSDGTTDYYYDDGGEAGTSDMLVGGFVPGGNFDVTDWSGTSNPSPNWMEVAAMDVPGFGQRIMPGDSIRVAFQWISAGTATTERGVYVDDVTLYGVGTLPYDIAAIGVKGLEMAAIGKEVIPEVIVANVGLNSITGTLLWTGDIFRIEGEDTTKVFAALFSSVRVTDFARDSVISMPGNPARAWVPEEPGLYLFKGKVSAPVDGDITNNVFAVTIEVFGPPFQEVVYRCDFEPRAGQTSLEDFGFTVVNDGGCDSTGLNNNTWAYVPFIFGDGSALLSWAWGTVDVGSDAVAPYDSSEVLDEYLITPPIDISHLEREATLYMQYYVYFRPGHPAVGAPFGEQWSDFDVDWSIDGGGTWHRAYHFEDHDSTIDDLPSRLPHMYYGPDDPRTPLSYLAHLGVDLTPALRMGGEELLIRFHVWSENSYFVGCDIDDIVVYSGVGHPILEDVVDVPDDNGKQVALFWRSSFSEIQWLWTRNLFGEYEQRFVTHYNIWRNSTGEATPKSAKSVASIEEMLANPGSPGDVYEVDGVIWEFVATVPKHHEPAYAYVAPTLWDGVPAAFMVSAHTNDPNVWVNSNIVEGVSEDNLAPSPPLTVTATQTDFTVALSWEPSPDEVGGPEDVQYYNIYRRAEGESFGEPIARVAEHEFVDTTVDTGKVYYYAISATDFAGNEGDKSAEVSLLVSAVAQSGSVVPTEFALDQNYPNPFNPTTTISFSLPKAAHVLLEVYNASGQKVATLVNKRMQPGVYQATWDASNMASGVYFYTIKAGQYSATKKMVLMR